MDTAAPPRKLHVRAVVLVLAVVMAAAMIVVATVPARQTEAAFTSTSTASVQTQVANNPAMDWVTFSGFAESSDQEPATVRYKPGGHAEFVMGRFSSLTWETVDHCETGDAVEVASHVESPFLMDSGKKKALRLYQFVSLDGALLSLQVTGGSTRTSGEVCVTELVQADALTLMQIDGNVESGTAAVEVAWRDVPGAVSYNVEHFHRPSGSSTFEWGLADTEGETTYQAPRGEVSGMRVQAVYDDGSTSQWSAAVFFHKAGSNTAYNSIVNALESDRGIQDVRPTQY